MLAAAALLLIVAALLAWIAGTRSGLSFAWGRIGPRLPQAVAVASVEGRLIGPLAVRGVKLDTDTLHLAVDAVDFDWSARELLFATVHVTNLAVRGVDYRVSQRTAAEPEGEPFVLPEAIDLPVKVQVDRVALEDLSLVTAPGGEPFVVDALRLRDAHLDDERWQFQSLNGHGPLFDVDGRAGLTPRGRYATEVNFSAALHLPATAVNATLRANGPLRKLDIDLQAEADSADFGRASLRAQAAYTPSAMTIEQFELNSPGQPGGLRARGQVALNEGNTMDLTVDWSKLRWPLPGEPAYRSDSGELAITGPLSDYQMSGRITWQVIGQARGELRLRGKGTLESFELARLSVSGGPGEISGNAAVTWSPALQARAHLRGHSINPGAVLADLPGDFDLAIDVSASQDSEGLRADISKLTADGTLRGQPLHLDAGGHYLGDALFVQHFKLIVGASTADISGRFGLASDALLDGRWTIESTDLATAWPALTGRLHSRGELTGSVAAPKVQATLSAGDLGFEENRVQRIELEADVDWSGATASQVDLDLNGVNAGGQAIRTVTLNLDGTPADHLLALQVDSDIASADLAMQGQLDRQRYREQFTLQRLRASYGELAPWTLAAPASGALSSARQSLENACFISTDARLCLNAHRDARASVARLALSDLPFDYASPFFPDGLDVDGTISASVEATLTSGGQPQVDVQVHTSAGSVSVTGAERDPVQVLDLRPGRMTATIRDNGLSAAVDLPLAGGEGIHASAEVAAGPGALTGHALDGRVQLGLASLDFIERLAPEVATFDGRLHGDVRLAGTLDRPLVSGRVGLDAGTIALVTPGLKLTGVSVAAIGRGDTIDLRAAATSGGGELEVAGHIALRDTGRNIELTIEGERFQVVHIPDATAYASPDLSVNVSPARITVNGSVTIPEASITPRNLPAAGVATVSDDQVIVGGDVGGAAAAAREIAANVEVLLGDQVRVEAFGLKAGLEGSLRVVQEPGNVPTGSGAINIVDGAYKAYGQNLDIQQGKILFAGGPVSEPGLDFRAARYPNDDVTVGVEVKGSLDNARLTLFSDPAMSQSEQLSWLLLGRPLEGASGEESSMVARAALALGGAGNKYLQNIGSNVGLDELGIGAAPGEGGAGRDSNSVALTVGKYLSPELYVSYGLGLFEPISTLTMRYTLSSHWQLQTQSSGAATGGDIIYTIDR
ncbi:MAG: translocation/assembly module TamB domain-containing protein [Halioglobus sp.]|nr:translocation/assembly module TamB domain-containing protein [Halioglobus sp.]